MAAAGGCWLRWRWRSSTLLSRDLAAGAEPTTQGSPAAAWRQPATARSVIFLFMEGGPSHIDTFDPKPALNRSGGQAASAELQARDHADGRRPGAAAGLAAKMEAARPERDLGLRLAAAHRDVRRRPGGDPIVLVERVESRRGRLPDEHGLDAGGPAVAGKLGDLRARERECEPARFRGDEGCPAGHGGRRARGTGAQASCRRSIRGRSSTAELQPIANLRTPAAVGPARQQGKLDYLGQLNRRHLLSRIDQSELDARIKSYELAFRMQAEAPEAVDLARETDATHALYGLDDPATDRIGRLCLLARRLVERGVRFVQIYCGAGSKWDAHSGIEANHAQTCRAMDRPVAGLLKDLKSRGLLEETLVVWGGEFGRTPMSEKGDGRDHNPYGFTMWMAGGGVKAGIVVGKTDEVGLHAIERPAARSRYPRHDPARPRRGSFPARFPAPGRPERPTVNEGRVFRGLFKD